MNNVHEIQVTPFDFQPVVIIGAARSGTNMLRDALVRLEGVVTWPSDEINYIWRHGRARRPNDELRPDHATPRVRRYIRRAFRKLARTTGARCIVEKTCANSLRVDFVRAVLPDAKFIFLIRDVRDVVASALKRWRTKPDWRYVLRKARYVPFSDVPYYGLRFLSHRFRQLISREQRLPTWGPRFDGIDAMLRECSLAEVCAEQWRQCVEQAAAALANVPPNQVRTLRYEDIVARPRSELTRLTEFLGLSASARQLSEFAADVRADSVGKWRRALDLATVAAIVHRCGPALQSWDYISARPLAA